LADVSQIQRLALKQLGVGHVNVRMGASMGSLQAWHFMAHEPSYVSNMVLVVPGGLELSQKTRTLTEQWVQKLEQDPDWHGGDYGSLARRSSRKRRWWRCCPTSGTGSSSRWTTACSTT
jgi:homoserine acetyltransferase